jgi:hypothetical protein
MGPGIVTHMGHRMGQQMGHCTWDGIPNGTLDGTPDGTPDGTLDALDGIMDENWRGPHKGYCMAPKMGTKMRPQIDPRIGAST